jgi:hypothetical protein
VVGGVWPGGRGQEVKAGRRGGHRQVGHVRWAGLPRSENPQIVLGSVHMSRGQCYAFKMCSAKIASKILAVLQLVVLKK